MFVLSILSLTATVGAAAVGAANDCPDYALITARGTGELPGPSAGFSGIFTEGMAKQALSALPNGVEYDVLYPADATPWSPFIGSADATRYIERALASCPQQKFALMGYSQGATVVLETLKSLEKPASDAIKAIVFLGNPYHVKNQASTVDENGGTATRAFDGSLLYLDRGLGLSSDLANSGKVLDICSTGDLVCCGISKDTLLSLSHLLYPMNKNVQKMGAEHLISRLR